LRCSGRRLGHIGTGSSGSLTKVFLLQYNMGVDVTEIYRLLPKIDCGQCPAKSCIAFAKALSEDCGMLSECGRLSAYSIMMIEALLCQGQ
jgi:ArsR family metal-binding transcriptional regulator